MRQFSGVCVLDSLKYLFCIVAIGVILLATTATNAADHGDDHAAKPEAAAADADPIRTLLFPETPDYNLPPVQPKLEMFLWTFILFGAFIFVMRSTTWLPLIAGINSREGRVINAERDAEAARREVEKLKEESDKRLAEVQGQVKALIAEARSEAEAQKREIVSKAEQEAQRIKDEALHEIKEAHASALSSLDSLVDNQVAMATEQIVGRRL